MPGHRPAHLTMRSAIPASTLSRVLLVTEMVPRAGLEPAHGVCLRASVMQGACRVGQLHRREPGTQWRCTNSLSGAKDRRFTPAVQRRRRLRQRQQQFPCRQRAAVRQVRPGRRTLRSRAGCRARYVAWIFPLLMINSGPHGPTRTGVYGFSDRRYCLLSYTGIR